MNIYEILRRPLITEKSVKQSGFRQYGFVVDKRATKILEALFKVDVMSVNTMVVPAKRGTRGGRRSRKTVVRNSPYKKAFVTVAEGQMIDVFEGVK
jgi:large subunit ribosomal protein L23